MWKKLGLRSRMLVTICTVTLLAFGLTIGIVTYMARGTVRDGAMATAEQTAWRYSASSGVILNDALDSARLLASIFAGIKNSGRVPDRKVLNEILKEVLRENQGFLGVWTCWEPNALDGQDSQWAGMPGHDGTGRYVPFWNRGGGQVALEPLAGYAVEGEGDYYLGPLRTGRETVTDPYECKVAGKNVLIISLVAPIKVNNKVVGAAGIDITMDKLQAMVSAIKPYETGDARLITSDGVYAAHPDPASQGKKISNTGVWPAVKRAVQGGKEYTVLDYSYALKTDVERIIVPIAVGGSGLNWGFLINVPMDKVMAQAASVTYITLIVGLVSMAILVAVVFLIAGSITKPIRRIVYGLGQGADQVSMASLEVSSSSQSLAEGSSQQAASLEETSASVEEITSMTRQNAANARQADSLMNESKGIVGSATNSMENLIVAMDRINQASDETAKIIKTIDEIAFQTNLLALNAAVEAARAGEAGAGFAVVADEVRNLALRAAEAAKNTTELIEGNIDNIRKGVELVNTTGDEFHKVAESAQKVAELVGEIAIASKEQADGLHQVNQATTEMDSVTQRVASSAEETAAASEELSAQSHTIKGMVYELVGLVEGEGKSTAQGSKQINSDSSKLGNTLLPEQIDLV